MNDQSKPYFEDWLADLVARGRLRIGRSRLPELLTRSLCVIGFLICLAAAAFVKFRVFERWRPSAGAMDFLVLGIFFWTPWGALVLGKETRRPGPLLLAWPGAFLVFAIFFFVGPETLCDPHDTRFYSTLVCVFLAFFVFAGRVGSPWVAMTLLGTCSLILFRYLKVEDRATDECAQMRFTAWESYASSVVVVTAMVAATICIYRLARLVLRDSSYQEIVAVGCTGVGVLVAAKVVAAVLRGYGLDLGSELTGVSLGILPSLLVDSWSKTRREPIALNEPAPFTPIVQQVVPSPPAEMTTPEALRAVINVWEAWQNHRRKTKT